MASKSFVGRVIRQSSNGGEFSSCIAHKQIRTKCSRCEIWFSRGEEAIADGVMAALGELKCLTAGVENVVPDLGVFRREKIKFRHGWLRLCCELISAGIGVVHKAYDLESDRLSAVGCLISGSVG